MLMNRIINVWASTNSECPSHKIRLMDDTILNHEAMARKRSIEVMATSIGLPTTHVCQH